MPISKWVDKKWYIYTMEYYAAERKKELQPCETAWMELESIMLSDICLLYTSDAADDPRVV